MPLDPILRRLPLDKVTPTIEVPLFLERSIVYLAYDETDDLLYVGLTDNLFVRIGQHSATSPWWPDLARLEIEVYTDRDSAAAREHDLIAELDPPHNDAGRTWYAKQQQINPTRRACRNAFTGCKNNAMKSEAYCRRCWLRPFKLEGPGEPEARAEWDSRQLRYR